MSRGLWHRANMQYNHAMVMQLFGPVSSGLVKAVEYHLERVSDRDRGRHLFIASLYQDGVVEVTPEPVFVAEMTGPDSYFFVQVFDCTRDEFMSNSDGASTLRVMVPLSLLTEKPKKYFLYKVSFQGEIGGKIDDTSRFQAGYIGITKRNPFTRFKEHQKAAREGEGHHLHKAWNALMKARVKRTLTFSVADHYKTLDEAYAAEERLVDELTLTPKGLNAIPGGMKGIRMMHQLRLLNGTHQVSVADRDAALVRLEGHHDSNSPCAHYRTGHFRTLPSGKLTWVSPCFVNLSIQQQLDIT